LGVYYVITARDDKDMWILFLENVHEIEISAKLIIFSLKFRVLEDRRSTLWLWVQTGPSPFVHVYVQQPINIYRYIT
jgi:hypothetical protein